MALFVELLVALVAAGVVAFLFMLGFERVGPWGIVWTFVVLVLLTWAIGAWTGPLGPPIGKVYWLPYLVVATILGAVLYLVVPPAPSQDTETDGDRQWVATAIVLAMGAAFWVLLIGSILALVVRVVRGHG
ncbi:MAG TPA: hypothetical protein EYH34_07680 [Planctomycetes bacterium]|nr:hypothetical protein [Planctomycetota bacterium]